MKQLFTLTIILISKIMWAQVPTWNNDVACIIYSHCSSCHNPTSIGFGDFSDYTTVKSMAGAIKNAVMAKRMPPYPPDTKAANYIHERLLSTTEIDLIKDWVDNNSPLGTGVSPIAPVYSGGSAIISPDLVIRMPTYTVNTLTGDLYRNFVVPTNLLADNKIKSIEVVPGNRGIVHHALIFQDGSNIPASLDALDPGPGYTSGGTGSNSSELVFGWVPGQGVQEYPNGFGMKLAGGTNIILQIHYPFGVVNELDSTKVFFKFDNSATRNILSDPTLNHGATLQNGPLFIPANTTKQFVEKFTVPADFTVFGVAPHMHKVGTAIKAFAVKPVTLDTTVLIDIPKWDFNWQGTYNFQQPIKIPTGTTLYAIAQYNNTASNPNNPNNPPLDVSKGEATTDEMMLVYFNYTAYQLGDENIIVDTASHETHFNNCTTVNVPLSIQTVKQNKLIIYPNPSQGNFIISHFLSNQNQFVIYDYLGRKVFEQHNLSSNEYVSTASLVKGCYMVKIIDMENGFQITSKLVMQ
jgi:hypothetical protein